jgi:hypothetical protein
VKPQALRPTPLWRLLVPAVVVALAATAPAARADNIDLGLIKKAPEILKYLKEHDYKNVGVLRFQVQKGRGKSSYSAGPLNGNMATRLENALLMEIDPKTPVGIIRDASLVAAAKAPGQHWNEGSAKDRAGLFDYAYPLAWGDNKVKADAFLHGRVKLSEDMRTTTVHIACFDRKSEKEHEVCAIEVKTDRTVLADAGQSYVLARGLVKKRRGEAKDANSLDDLLNDDAAKNAKDRDDGNNNNGKKNGSALTNEYLDFEVCYDDQPQQLTGDASEGGELRIAPPRTGQTVSFRCKNKTRDDIGLVIYVNGTSTLEMMRDPPENCRRWILPANDKSYWITGYVDENDVRTPFKIVGPGNDLVKNELAEKLGQIEVVVFLKGEDQPVNNNGGEMLVSRHLNLRKLSPVFQRNLGITGKPKTAAEARKLAFRSAGLKVPVRPRDIGDGEAGFIVPDPTLREQIVVEQQSFPNPTAVATPIVIRYNDRAAN